jgi:hypothetical protein
MVDDTVDGTRATDANGADRTSTADQEDQEGEEGEDAAESPRETESRWESNGGGPRRLSLLFDSNAYSESVAQLVDPYAGLGPLAAAKARRRARVEAKIYASRSEAESAAESSPDAQNGRARRKSVLYESNAYLDSVAQKTSTSTVRKPKSIRGGRRKIQSQEYHEDYHEEHHQHHQGYRQQDVHQENHQHHQGYRQQDVHQEHGCERYGRETESRRESNGGGPRRRSLLFDSNAYSESVAQLVDPYAGLGPLAAAKARRRARVEAKIYASR